MKGYVEQLERLGYVLSQDLSVGLIMNGLTSDFAGFVRNYNMHNMGKTIGGLHALLIEYEKGLTKKAATPQVMAIQGGRIQKANKKSLKKKCKGKGKGKDKHGYIPKFKSPKPSAKEHPTKDDACHHCKEVGHWKRNCPANLAELIKKKKQVGTASSLCIFTIELFSRGSNLIRSGLASSIPSEATSVWDMYRRKCHLLNIKSQNHPGLPWKTSKYIVKNFTGYMGVHHTYSLMKQEYEL
nr:hypothetical protein [Tanacetum cinerariifolium]